MRRDVQQSIVKAATFPTLEAAKNWHAALGCEELPLTIDELMALLRTEVLVLSVGGLSCAVYIPDDVAQVAGVAIGKWIFHKLHPEVRDET